MTTLIAEDQRHRAESQRRLAEDAQRVAEQERQNAGEQALLAARQAQRAERLESQVDILRLKALLSDLYDVRLIKDGTIGPMTVHWLKQFQSDMGMDATGEFDANTQACVPRVIEAMVEVSSANQIELLRVHCRKGAQSG